MGLFITEQKIQGDVTTRGVREGVLVEVKLTRGLRGCSGEKGKASQTEGTAPREARSHDRAWPAAELRVRPFDCGKGAGWER